MHVHDQMETEARRLAVKGIFGFFVPSCTHLPLHVQHTWTKNIYNVLGQALHMNCISDITVQVQSLLLVYVFTKYLNYFFFQSLDRCSPLMMPYLDGNMLNCFTVELFKVFFLTFF